MITRRQTLQLLGTAAATAFSPRACRPSPRTSSAQDLAVPGPLGDVALGPADAKVTIIEYASLTCSHCAAFHKDDLAGAEEALHRHRQGALHPARIPARSRWPRPASCSPAATATTNITRSPTCCSTQQRNWAFTDKPLDALRAMMRQAGFSQEKFDACLKDQKLYDAVNAVKNRGMEQFKVDSTPTFFINGQRHPGNLSIDELEKVIKPMLGE